MSNSRLVEHVWKHKPTGLWTDPGLFLDGWKISKTNKQNLCRAEKMIMIIHSLITMFIYFV